jgi:hypothetical protein
MLDLRVRKICASFQSLIDDKLETIRRMNRTDLIEFLLHTACILQQHPAVIRTILAASKLQPSNPSIYFIILDLFAAKGYVRECEELYKMTKGKLTKLHYLRGTDDDATFSDLPQYGSYLIVALSNSESHNRNVCLALAALHHAEARGEAISCVGLAAGMDIAMKAQQPGTALRMFDAFFPDEYIIRMHYQQSFAPVNSVFICATEAAKRTIDPVKAIDIFHRIDKLYPAFSLTTPRSAKRYIPLVCASNILTSCELAGNLSQALDIMPRLLNRLECVVALHGFLSFQLFQVIGRLQGHLETGHLEGILHELRNMEHVYRDDRNAKSFVVISNKSALPLSLQFDLLLPCLAACEKMSQDQKTVHQIIGSILSLGCDSSGKGHVALFMGALRATAAAGLPDLSGSVLKNCIANSFEELTPSVIDEMLEYSAIACIRGGQMEKAKKVLTLGRNEGYYAEILEELSNQQSTVNRYRFTTNLLG